MTYFLGIDQGGSKTAAVVGDEFGNILGLGKSFGAVHSMDGMEKAVTACRDACRQAVSEAGIRMSDVALVYSGMSGIDWKGESELVADALKRTLMISAVDVVNDCIIAMRAGSNASNRAVLCAGSGYNCAVHSGEREIIYGFYIPDHLQGGSAIGEGALQKVFDAEIGIGQPTHLTQELLAYFHASSVDELLRMKVEGRIDTDRKLYLPRMVEQAALNGDTAANDILSEFAKGIIPYLISGMKKLNILNQPTDVVVSGSIFKCKAPILMKTVTSEIGRQTRYATVINAKYEPVVGAYLLALDAYFGETVSMSIKNNKNFNILRERGGSI